LATFVNKAARYCRRVVKGEVLISPEMHERVWRIVQIEPVMIETKHEGKFVVYRVKCVEGGSARETKI